MKPIWWALAVALGHFSGAVSPWAHDYPVLSSVVEFLIMLAICRAIDIAWDRLTRD